MEKEKKALLTNAGHALYGERWQTDLARDLGLSDGRRIRQWLSGDRPIPAGVWQDVCRLLERRKILISEAIDGVAKGCLLISKQ